MGGWESELAAWQGQQELEVTIFPSQEGTW